jgi:hypothetical protein
VGGILLACSALAGWFVISLVVGGLTALYCTLGLPAVGLFIAAVIIAIWGLPGGRK